MGYDTEAKVLEVEFKGKAQNSVYRYVEVPIELAEGLFKAESPGTFLHANIKTKFTCTKVEAQS
jgi:hypothetical protein